MLLVAQQITQAINSYLCIYIFTAQNPKYVVYSPDFFFLFINYIANLQLLSVYLKMFSYTIKYP